MANHLHEIRDMTLSQRIFTYLDIFAHFARRKSVWLSSLFTVCILFSPSLGLTAPACTELFAKARNTLSTKVETAEIAGTHLEYIRVEEAKVYRIERDLPSLRDAFLIHFDLNGHVSLWYRNTRIDSVGHPLIYVKGKMKTFYRSIDTGVVFAIRNLPEGFEERFQEFVKSYRSRLSLTCVSNACGSLTRLDLNEAVPKKYYTASGLYRHLLKLAANSPEKIEVWALGYDLKEVEAQVRSNQKRFIFVNGLFPIIIGYNTGIILNALFSLFWPH